MILRVEKIGQGEGKRKAVRVLREEKGKYLLFGEENLPDAKRCGKRDPGDEPAGVLLERIRAERDRGGGTLGTARGQAPRPYRRSE